ncbi:MAG: SRPBCC family protein [Candidatus Limnocylindria bacterium]
MRRVQGTVFIAAPPAEVYAFLSEPTNVPRWQTGVVSSERTSPAPTVTGSTGRVVLEVMGRRVTANTRVLEAVPDRRLAMTTSVSGISVAGSLDLAPAEGGTKLTFSSEVKAESIFMAPLERMVTDAVERDMETSLARLKAVLAADAEPTEA